MVTDMVSFEAFRAVDGTPVYLQIINFIKRGAIAGTIRDGDELPSRRVLSALLGINPNTVQKAFHMLEEEHLMESRTGTKSCMTLPPDILDALRRESYQTNYAPWPAHCGSWEFPKRGAATH